MFFRPALLIATALLLGWLPAPATAQTSEIGSSASQLETLEQRQGTVISRLDEIAAREARVNRKESTVRTAESDLTAEQRALEAERRRLEENSVQLKAERAAAEEAARLAAERERQEPTRVEAIAELAADTPFDVELGTTLSSHGSRVGDRFSTRLDHDLVTADGVLVAPAGSELRGVVTEAVPLKKVGGRARLGLRFGELVLPSGKTVELAATLFEIGRNETKRDAAKIGGGAAAGALLGHLIDKDDGAVLGALIGAAAGTAASRGKGGELEIPAGTILRLSLDQPLRVAVPWTPPRR